jgi:hypothetical protein
MNQHKLIKILTTLSLLALLAACGSTAIKPEHAQNIHRVGVISFLGDVFRIYDGGVNRVEWRRLELPGWNLRAVVQKTIKEELGKNTRISYVSVSAGKDIQAEIYNRVLGDIREDATEFSTSPKLKHIADDLKLLGEKNKIDTWILIYPAKAYSPILQQNYFTAGAGAIREFTLLGSKAAIFVNLSIDVVTASNAEVIGHTDTADSEEVDIEVWEKADKLPSSDMPENVISDVKRMISTQLKQSLNQMQLSE